MRLTCSKRVNVHIWPALAAWSVWKLPRRVAIFVVAVITADLVAIALAASFFTVRSHDVALFCLLLTCNAATVELTRRSGEHAGAIKDVYAVWELPIAILLPPLYAFIAPIVRMSLVQWRIRRSPLHRRLFSSAALGLAFGSASLLFHLLSRVAIGPAPTPGMRASLWVVAVAACGILEWAVNSALIMTAVKGSDPSARVRDMAFSREPLFNDITELCVAFLVAFAAAMSMLVVLFAFPFVILLQRSLRHAQLVNESRIDSKTGLLNAGTWEREAMAEVARASRTRNPLAVALIDIDKFKRVNDTYGHLVGDQVLKEISASFRDHLREYDLAGRFGGEEFVLLLPHTTDRDAHRIAERMRAHIAGMPIGLDGMARAEPVHVTVSIGVAVLDATRRDLTDLLAAADAALYQAKAAGRDRVHMVAGIGGGAGGTAGRPVSQPS
ncbi:MAG TPA: GGDEF domain-containing protein [Streptosporangiaceae bacterium]